MSVTGKLFAKVLSAAFNEEIDLLDDTIKVMLTDDNYVPNQDTHEYLDDITDEISGTGYSAGGATLGSKTITYTAGSNEWVFDGADVSWATSTLTDVATAVVYDSTPGSDATRPLICYQTESVPVSTAGGTLAVVWAAAGIVKITVG